METGTLRGGSALFFGDLCTLLGHGHVVSVDLAPVETPPHSRVSYLTCSSTESAVVADVDRLVAAHGPNVFVMLDSDHHEPHVRAELDAYAHLIPVGGFIHVQDGWSWNGKSPRPMPAGPLRRCPLVPRRPARFRSRPGRRAAVRAHGAPVRVAAPHNLTGTTCTTRDNTTSARTNNTSRV